MHSVQVLAVALLTGATLAFGGSERAARLLSQAGTVKTMFAAEARQPRSEPTIASLMDREISAVQEQIVAAAEAMPEGTFDFTPEALNLPGSEYKGVRTFAVQVKHIAASNYAIWSHRVTSSRKTSWAAMDRRRSERSRRSCSS